ncbi:MAG: isoprenylcysteine carboxylmethyltransferase family protein [Acetobacteraceae bacterium]|nr:isoprenylcysteine carboxylmethyltransferase family protein [Acetobacteraceae bacterium]
MLWLAYWTVAAGRTKPVARAETIASRLSHLLPLGIGVALLSLHAPGLLGRRWLPYSEAGFWAGAALVAAGLGFAVWARVHLAGNWSGTVTLKQDHSLTRSGPYGWVRHPIYTGLLLALLGSAIANGSWAGLLGLLAIALAFLRKIGIEERFLGAQFGEAYARYRSEVPALLPWPRR